MRIKLMSLRFVPEDEISEIKTLLTEADIEFYLTDAGNFGVSLPALWLPDAKNEIKARYLLIDYQKNREKTARERYLSEKTNGQNWTILDKFYHNPVKFLLYVVAMAFFIYLLILPALLIKQ